MVSFSCEACGDVLLKKKLDAHRRQCANASYTCLDCMTTFENYEYRSHTSCISEQQKYQGALYRPGKQKSDKQKGLNPTTSTIQNSQKTMQIASTGKPHSNMNVFDFLDTDQASLVSDSEHLKGGLRYLDNGQMKSPHVFREINVNIAKNNHHQTPAAKNTLNSENRIDLYRDKTDTGDVLNGTKRKRLHLESRSPVSSSVNATKDNVKSMVLHSQLTGDLTRMMRHPSTFPSGPLISPTSSSPPTKTKGTKKRKETFSIGSGVKAFITAKPLPAKLPARSSSKSSTKPEAHLLEEHPKMKRRSITEATSDKDDESLVVYKPRSKQGQILYGLIEKGLESPRGVSMGKALKKLNRERELLGLGTGKATNEKELLKDLRVRRNERGELVLFV
ncbi:putative zinc finger c2h2 lyar-type protein [Erysiphe neolycopersici]|uniref:Putative zinc finger c2h2 lyar-type protein n=1 Tax=Erysiphe neolycopersici TaxID=212602 RepID=A0A420HTY0_9PEZI|nr:putative zinc finger c2h2 lyar-type protein [Erysiphe neolycopersici]